MASRMREAGYATAGIVTNSNVAPSLGFGQGFDTYEYLPEQHTPEMHQLSDVVNEHAFAWLRNRPRDRPFFLYLHTTDPHDPYMPRSPYRERFAAGIDPALGLHLSVWKRNRTETASARDIHDLAALYDGEIAFVDEQFGRLLDELRELGIYDSTLIVLIADHGEEFHEHGTWTHSNNLFTETTHVPLLIKLPKQWGGGTVSDGLAQQVDLLPTVLQASASRSGRAAGKQPPSPAPVPGQRGRRSHRVQLSRRQGLQRRDGQRRRRWLGTDALRALPGVAAGARALPTSRPIPESSTTSLHAGRSRPPTCSRS